MRYAASNAHDVVVRQIADTASESVEETNIAVLLDTVSRVVEQNALEIRREMDLKEERSAELTKNRLQLEHRLESSARKMEDLNHEVAELKRELQGEREKVVAEAEKRRALEQEMNAIHQKASVLVSERKHFDREYKKQGKLINSFIKKCQAQIKRKFGYIPPDLAKGCLSKAPSFAHAGSAAGR